MLFFVLRGVCLLCWFYDVFCFMLRLYVVFPLGFMLRCFVWFFCWFHAAMGSVELMFLCFFCWLYFFGCYGSSRLAEA